MKTIPVWLFRLAWASLPLTLAPGVDQALGGRVRAVQLAGTVLLWVFWAIALVAALVPTTVSLTLVRSVAPGTLLVTVAAWTHGASASAGSAALAVALIVTASAFSGDLGETFAQGSAYGDERRLPLRPPGPLVLILPVTWVVAAAAWIIGPLATASGTWLLGLPVLAVAAAVTVPLGRRYHRLSRRWLVVVPAGIVIHDPVLLAETTMFARTDVVEAGLALVGTEAADLTGTALGPRVELRLREMTTVVLAAPPRGQTTALHVLSVLVCPTRPGRALEAIGVSA